MKTLIAGREGEAAAARYLRKKGYKVISAGYRSRYGEIDIIAEDGDTVVFVEVKLRKNDVFANAFEAVTARKMEKIRLTASQWLAENDRTSPARFDIIEIYTDYGTVNHIENAFT